MKQFFGIINHRAEDMGVLSLQKSKANRIHQKYLLLYFLNIKYLKKLKKINIEVQLQSSEQIINFEFPKERCLAKTYFLYTFV